MIRRAGEADVADVARLFAGFRDWFGRDVPRDGDMQRVVAELVHDPMTEFLLVGEPPEGVCQLRFRLSVWTGAEDCWLEDLFVSEEARGRGVGRALLGAAVDRAKARGCRRIELDVNEDNEPALALYAAAGFTTEPKPPGRTLFISKKL